MPTVTKKPNGKKNQNQKKQKKQAPSVGEKMVQLNQNQRKKQSRKQQALRRYVDPRTIGTFVLPTQQAEGKNAIVIPATLSINSLLEGHTTFLAYILSLNLFESDNSVNMQIKLQKFYNGASYMLRGVMRSIFGEPALEQRPRVVHDWISALTPKDVKYRGTGTISYSWGGTEPPGTDSQNLQTTEYSTAWGTWQCTYPVLETGTYDCPAVSFNTQQGLNDDAANDYTFFLNVIQKISPNTQAMLETVASSVKSVLGKDASTFARVYTYCGLNPSLAGGFYNDAENEVNITSPQLTGYNSYVQPDQRVPSKMTVTAGGPAKGMGIALSSLWQLNPTYYNHVTPVFKFINLDTIVCHLVYWLVNLVLAGATGPVFTTFPFSLQDFRIMVRQSLLSSVFRDQFMAQFMGPQNYDSQSNNFLPCMVMGHTFGNKIFDDLRVPNLLMENLSALQANGYKISSKQTGRAMVSYYPVLGYYDKDTPPNYQIDTGEGFTPVFATLPAQAPIDIGTGIIEGSSVPGTPVNLNSSYYGTVLALWNEKIAQYSNVSVATSPIGNCQPPKGLHLLSCSQKVGTLVASPNEVTGSYRLPVPALKYISNSKTTLADFPKGKELTKQSSKGKPLLVPPAQVALLSLPQITSSYPLNKEIYQFLRFLILPEYRESPGNVEDVLTDNMYQTITGESNKYPITTLNPDYIERAMKFGQYCTVGLAGGSNNNVYQTVLTALESAGRGGFLASLLGGVAKSIFPGNDGLIDTIANVVPV